MPIASRPHDTDGHSIQQRRSFRPMPDFKRAKSNGNGNGQYVRNGNQNNGRTTPPESTHAENFYYLKQMSSRTPMVLVLTDGEEIHGCIEWYDKTCLKVNREGAPNLLIQKHSIKYLFKKEELE
jgi:sRNA-binding regulator protein Hfq